jgi:Tol biopolymer transport system component
VNRLLPSPPARAIALFCLLFAVLPASLGAQFGKNKVQYDRFDFKTLETEHFLIHFYPEEERAVYDAARMAERAYGRLSRIFNHSFTEKRPIILYASHSDFQQTNIFNFDISEGTGGITEGLRDRVVIPFTGSMKEFDHVLTHELVHSFQFDILRLGALSRGANPFSNQPPLWFIEGMAEYLSIGEIDPHTAMWLRDGGLSGYLTSLRELSQAGDIRVYRYGQAIWSFIGRKYGDEKVGEIMQKVPVVGWQEAITSSLNMRPDEFSERWLESVRRTFFPEIARFKRPDEVGKAITHHRRERASFNLAPALSPDGKRVAFLSDRDFFQDLFLADAETGEIEKKLVAGNRTESFETLRFLSAGLAFSHDGKYLAFTAKAGDEDALYVLKIDGRDVVGEFRFGLEGVLTPSWSPDDSKLVFAGLDGGVTDLFIVDRDGTNLRRLTDDLYMDRDPVWSPDGKRIAFTTDRGEGTDLELLKFRDPVIGIYDLAQGSITLLPDQEGKNINPQWSPDGGAIAYISDRNGVSNIFLQELSAELRGGAGTGTEAAGGRIYQLTNLLTGVTGIIESQPAFSWSADGSAIVFSAFNRAGWDLYRISNPRALATAPYDPASAERANLELALEGPFGDTVLARPRDDRDDRDDEEVETEAGQPETPNAAPEAVPSQSIYLGRLGDGEEVSDSTAMADRRRVRKPGERVDVAGLLKDPTINLPDTTRFSVRDYKVKLEPDVLARPSVGYIQGEGAFGASQISFSDILGNHQLGVAAAIYGSLTESDIYVRYLNLARRTNWGVSAFQFRNDFSSLLADPAINPSGSFLARSDIYRGGQFFLSRPSNRFRRWELGVEATAVDRRLVRYDFFDLTPDVLENISNEFYASPILAHVFDNTLFGYTGPILGSRYRFDIQQTFGDRQYTQFLGDVRKYVRIARFFTLAGRALYLGSYGDFEDVRIRSIGGATLLRGYEYDDIRVIGNQIGVANLELRFPIAESLKLGPVLFPPIRGAAFFDTGFAFFSSCPEETENSNTAFCQSRDDFRPFRSDPDALLGFRLNDLRGSYGFGLRTNLFGFAVLKADWAWRTDLAGTSPESEFHFVIAPEF